MGSAEARAEVSLSLASMPPKKRVKYYSCSLCNKEYACPRALGGHQTLHRNHRKAIRDLTSQQNAAELGALPAFGQQVEKPVRYYPCKLCSKTFASPTALGGHQTSHREERKQAKQADIAHSAMHEDKREQAMSMEHDFVGDVMERDFLVLVDQKQDQDQDHEEAHCELNLSLKL